MLSITNVISNYQYKRGEKQFRKRRDWLVHLITEGINRERIGTDYKPVTELRVAILLNKNPILARSDDEVEYLYKVCNEKGNFSKFWWVVNNKK